MGCGCRGSSSGRGGNNDTLGYYVVTPAGQTLPPGVNPEDPAAGTPPYMLYAEAHAEVIGIGGTIHRLRRKR